MRRRRARRLPAGKADRRRRHRAVQPRIPQGAPERQRLAQPRRRRKMRGPAQGRRRHSSAWLARRRAADRASPAARRARPARRRTKPKVSRRLAGQRRASPKQPTTLAPGWMIFGCHNSPNLASRVAADLQLDSFRRRQARPTSLLRGGRRRWGSPLFDACGARARSVSRRRKLQAKWPA